MDPLAIVAVNTPNKPDRKVEEQKKFDHLWQVAPEQFDPERNCMENTRLARTWMLIEKTGSLKDQCVVDLGCGKGVLAKKLAKAGAIVNGVDISPIALKQLDSSVHGIHDYVPRTKLPDDTYDLVIATELIAYLPQDELRLFFSELARLVSPDGYVVCSTPLDIYSEDALQRFAQLAETEFSIETWTLSYHRFYIHLRNFFEAPRRFFKAKQDPDYRERQLERRRGFSKSWFRLNSATLPASFWYLVQWVSRPIASLIRHSQSLLIGLEKCCRFLFADTGISHALFLAKRRALITPPKDEQPIEKKHKKQLWE